MQTTPLALGVNNMETASLCHTRTSLPINKIVKQFPKSCESHRRYLRMPSAYKGLQSDVLSLNQRFGHVLAVGCVASESGLLAKLERELVAGMKPEEEWMRVGRLRERYFCSYDETKVKN